METIFKSFGMTRKRNELKVYQLQSGRSNHYTIAHVILTLIEKKLGYVLPQRTGLFLQVYIRTGEEERTFHYSRETHHDICNLKQ